jgi:opacity protein-like surface antigen
VGLGARLRYDLGDIHEGLGAVGSFDFFFPGNDVPGVDVSYWELNANATYDIPVQASIKPYAGAGLVFGHVSAGSVSDSKVGLNALGGINFKIGEQLKAFVEAKFEIRSGSQFVVSGGVRF